VQAKTKRVVWVSITGNMQKSEWKRVSLKKEQAAPCKTIEDQTYGQRRRKASGGWGIFERTRNKKKEAKQNATNATMKANEKKRQESRNSR